jgi:hypothetical protein
MKNNDLQIFEHIIRTSFFIQNILNINKNDFKNIKSILDIKDGFFNIYLNMK